MDLAILGTLVVGASVRVAVTRGRLGFDHGPSASPSAAPSEVSASAGDLAVSRAASGFRT